MRLQTTYSSPSPTRESWLHPCSISGFTVAIFSSSIEGREREYGCGMQVFKGSAGIAAVKKLRANQMALEHSFSQHSLYDSINSQLLSLTNEVLAQLPCHSQLHHAPRCLIIHASRENAAWRGRCRPWRERTTSSRRTRCAI